MITLRIEHEISDFDTWKAAFDRDPIGRDRAGVRDHRIFRPVDDPSYVLIDLDFDSANEAEAFLAALHRDVWRSAAAAPALIGSPRTRLLDAAVMMSASHYADAVSAHYTAGDLDAKILASLRAAGMDPDALQVEELARLEQFHAGGADATRALIRRAGIEPGTRVLDVGGGLGGPARLLAHDTGATVTVLDLSEESCRVGELLTARVGLADRVTFRHGSAIAMPFADGAFDRVWTQHAALNVAEKERLYREIHRVLRPGGWFAMQEVMAGPVQPIHFPVPWAGDAGISFLRPPEEIRALLAEVGFRELEWADEREAALAALQALAAGATGTGPLPLAALVIGPRLAEMQRNVGRNLREDRLTLVQAVFERP